MYSDQRIDILLFLFSFVLLWIGSGLAVGAISKISHLLKASSFFVSFFVLGLFTSITEILVGVNALIEGKPEIYVGNLLGGSVMIFIFIIPLIAVIGNGVRLNHSFRFQDLVTASLVVGLPSILTLDNNVSRVDALIMVIIYSYFIYTLGKESEIVNRVLHISLTQKTLVISFFKIVAAVILVFSASRILVEETPKLGELLHISPFVVSILLISLGTNIPELSIAVRSLISGKKDIAFGNYVGSATLNTLEMGILTLIGKSAPADGSNYSVLAFVGGLILFVRFVKTKNEISRKEGLYLLLIYLIFVAFELFTGSGWKFVG